MSNVWRLEVRRRTAAAVVGLLPLTALAGCGTVIPIPIPINRTEHTQRPIYPQNYQAAELADKANRELRTLVFGATGIPGICRRVANEFTVGNADIKRSKDRITADTEDLVLKVGKTSVVEVGYPSHDGVVDTKKCYGDVAVHDFKLASMRDTYWENPHKSGGFKHTDLSSVYISLEIDRNNVAINNGMRLERLVSANSSDSYNEAEFNVPDTSQPNDRANQISCDDYWTVSVGANFVNSFMPDPKIDSRNPYHQGIRC